MKTRSLDIVIISDVHLGTFGSHARELYQYLRSISPKTLILNGDIIDFWQAKKKHFPAEHIEVIKQILQMALNGTTVYYITGNHDDVLRRLSEISLGNLHLRNKLVLQVNNKKHWIFHGDVFDSSVTLSPFLAKLGGKSYDYLILLNRTINKFRKRFGKEPLSFSKSIKSGVKRAIKFINDFEDIAVKHAIQQGYDYVICGHIHEPQMRDIKTSKGKVTYLNSGDWVENLTSLEYVDNQWSLYRYEEEHYSELKKLSYLDLKHKEASFVNKTTLSVTDLQQKVQLVRL